jgi:NAD(P) transhydrogenase subunit alpha
MIIAVPTETFPGERRVALVPASLKALARLGVEVHVQAGAGAGAHIPDAEYQSAGARIVVSRDELFQTADIVVQVRAAAANPQAGAEDIARLRPGQCLIAQCDPLSEAAAMSPLAQTRAVVFALELVPRITRAQSMDVLSSMATIAGYEAVLLAATHLPQMFPMLMTAAGTLAPARVLVIGAGVAGLQAIATARRLGAVVQAYDVRAVVKEQVQSLGARFVEMDLESGEGRGGYAREMNEEFYRRQRELLLKVVRDCDVVITTASIPGKPAPMLITGEMVQAMPPGSVVVDLAAERGGNCELTRPGETVEAHGVTILGPLNLASGAPRHASQMYSNNLTTLLKSLIKNGDLVVDLTDEVIAGTLLAKGGELVHPQVRAAAGLPPLAAPPADAPRTIKLAGDDEPNASPPTTP